MIRWSPHPLVRVAAFYVLGILLALPMSNAFKLTGLLWLAGVLTLIVLLSVVFIRKRAFYTYNLWLSTLMFALFAVYGYLNVKLQDQSDQPGHFLNVNNILAYQVLISDDGQEKAKTHRFLGEVVGVKDSTHWHKAQGKVYLYLSKDSRKDTWHYGDVLLVDGRPEEVRSPGNPGEFDYRQFLAYKNIYHQDFVKDKWLKLNEGKGYVHIAYGYLLRNWASYQFDLYLSALQERQILKALVLGIKDGLDTELSNAYAASGAMHVLAVSGLHVGIVYVVITFLFGRWQHRKYGRWVFGLISLSALWMYALLTGFSPSVLRAATMFSFLVVAKAGQRQTNIYNTLAASALLLLIYDPFMIMSVGFQLSYLAVIGIVYLYPRIYRLWYIENRWLDKIWSLTVVAIAAQAATFPLGLFYFHSFPSLFLLSNLAVIPGALVTLIGGFILLAVSFVPFLADVVGNLLQWWVMGMNYVVFFIEKLPYSQVTGIYITPSQTGLIIVMVILLILTLAYKRRAYLYTLVVFCVCFIGYTGNLAYRNNYRTSIIFYDVPGHTVIESITGRTARVWMDHSLSENSATLDYKVEPNHLKSAIDQISFIDTKAEDGLLPIMAHDKSVLLLMDVREGLSFREKIQVDYLVYTRSCKKGLEWVSANFVFNHLLLDGSLFANKVERLKKEANRLQIPYYSIADQGAFQVNISTH